MHTLRGIGVTLLLGSSLAAQQRTAPAISGSFGNVVFPGGTSATPGIRRNFGNVAFPGTGGPKVTIPFSITDPTFGARLGQVVSGQSVWGPSGYAGTAGTRANWRRPTTIIAPLAVGFPVYTGGYETPYAEGPVQQQPNITVIYPPQQTPVVLNQYGSGDARQSAPADTVSVYQAPVRSGDNPNGQSLNEPVTGYLIAFKDHAIYSAVAYWVEGDTLHYFTSGNVHNQASVSLVDRELTERLNREKGTEVRLPK
jgi:hypothetical protein